jgi:hypothetical protein
MRVVVAHDARHEKRHQRHPRHRVDHEQNR